MNKNVIAGNIMLPNGWNEIRNIHPFFNVCLRDFNDDEKYIGITKWNKINSFKNIYQTKLNTNFEEVIFNRSIWLLNKAKTENKKIVLFWSGGIDSTTILTSFLYLEPNMVKVMYSDSTKEESMGLFYWFKKYFIFKPLDFNVLSDPNVIVVNGTNGDQILTTNYLDFEVNKKLELGYFGMSKNSYHTFWDSDPTEFLTINLKDKVFSDEMAKIFLKLWYTCPFKLPSVAMGIWYFSFNIFHQSACLRSLELNPNFNKINLYNYEPFYNNDEIQRYSLNMMENNVYDLEKKQMKEIIYKYTKNQQYAWKKVKKPSWPAVNSILNWKAKTLVLIDNEGNYQTGKECIIKHKEKYE